MAKIGLAVAVIALPIALFAVAIRSPSSLLIPIVLLAVAAALLSPSLIRALRWHPAELVLPDQPVVLGGEVSAIYRRRPRRQRDLPTGAIETRLLCQERATYRVGTDTRTVTTDVVSETTTSTGAGAPRGFEAPVRVEVPTSSGAPTMSLPNNKIVWTISIRVSAGDGALPTDTATFPLEVSPVLDPRYRVGPLDDRIDR
jgi:hypothetical protein